MDNNQMNKAIGYAILIIIAYHIIGAFIPFLTYAVIFAVAGRIILFYLQSKK